MKLKVLLSIFAAMSFALSSPASAAPPLSKPAKHVPVISASMWYQPLMNLPQQPTIRCILKAESQSTEARPNLTDTNQYQYGPFQFTTILWNRWSWVAGVGRKTSSWFLGSIALNAVTIPAHRATLRQQARVFATVVRNDGYGMWTNFDGCV
jgi:hypothetical protein